MNLNQNKYGNGQTDGVLTPYGLQQKAFEQDKSMKSKLSKIAELFEMDVLTDNDALKACGVVIQQHAKTQGKLENATE